MSSICDIYSPFHSLLHKCPWLLSKANLFCVSLSTLIYSQMLLQQSFSISSASFLNHFFFSLTHLLANSMQIYIQLTSKIQPLLTNTMTSTLVKVTIISYLTDQNKPFTCTPPVALISLIS